MTDDRGGRVHLLCSRWQYDHVQECSRDPRWRRCQGAGGRRDEWRREKCQREDVGDDDTVDLEAVLGGNIRKAPVTATEETEPEPVHAATGA